ncbi:hypothetical protein GCM10027514_17790 [Azotobacter armeniacus]
MQELQNDTNDVDPNSAVGDNYWGYMTLNYFAPDRRYASDRSPGGPSREWKAMVKAFHGADIKVYVDVVYNHTGEGAPWDNSDGETVYNIISWRGLDNPTYYSLTSDLQSPWDNTGMDGNYNTRNVVAQNLIIDSLAYWRDTLGVDGFRFDLASVLGTTCEHGCFHFDGTAPGNALNRIAAELPPRPVEGGEGIDLIAEPWAFGDSAVHRRRRSPAYAVRQQQHPQPGFTRQLAELDPRYQRRNRSRGLYPPPDQFPQGASGNAPGTLLFGGGPQRQRDGAAALVQARRRAGRQCLSQRPAQPSCHCLAYRRHGTR